MKEKIWTMSPLKIYFHHMSVSLCTCVCVIPTSIFLNVLAESESPHAPVESEAQQVQWIRTTPCVLRRLCSVGDWHYYPGQCSSLSFIDDASWILSSLILMYSFHTEPRFKIVLLIFHIILTYFIFYITLIDFFISFLLKSQPLGR